MGCVPSEDKNKKRKSSPSAPIPAPKAVQEEKVEEKSPEKSEQKGSPTKSLVLSMKKLSIKPAKIISKSVAAHYKFEEIIAEGMYDQ